MSGYSKTGTFAYGVLAARQEIWPVQLQDTTPPILDAVCAAQECLLGRSLEYFEARVVLKRSSFFVFQSILGIVASFFTQRTNLRPDQDAIP
jgi:hypothetical protein